MREPADDGATERTSRRHGRGPQADAARQSGSADERGRDQAADLGGRGRRGAPPGAASAGRHSASHAVFTPGYTRAETEPDPRRRPAPDGLGDPDRGSASGQGYRPPGGGMAARGPVRGYAPTPGQPPPMYPPGQFAAWNRRRDGQPGRDLQPADQGDQQSGTGPNSVQQAPGATGPASRYYAQDVDPAAEPGYSTLAVSDPAADVTSTQTWRALGDGRATGIWSAPPGLREQGAGTTAAAGSAAPPGSPLVAPPGRAATGLPSRPMRHAAGSPRPTGADPRTQSGPNPRVSTGPNPRVSTGPNPRVSTGPNPRVSTAAVGADDAAATRSDEPPAKGRRGVGARTGRRPRRRRSLSVMLAMGAAALLVVGAAATLVYTVLHTSPKPNLTGQSSGKRSPSSSASPSLGPYGDIASRQSDPQPLTLAELYPASFIAIGTTMTNVATSIGTDCASAIVGAALQSAVGAADCTQVARATYVDVPGSLMGTIGVFNLSTGDAAKTAEQAADANDFVSQLTAASGPAQQIGQGTGIEEALAKGHYLILIWAEFSNFVTPNAQNSNLIEQFINLLVTNTANKDLTARMLTGAP